MSSSDSEEDCYGNVAKTLHNLKSNYCEDKLDSVNLLDDSLEVNNLVNTHEQKIQTQKVETQKHETVETQKRYIVDDTLSDDEEVDRIIAENTTKRVTRSSSNKSFTELNVSTNRKRGRGRGRQSGQLSISEFCSDTSQASPSRRNRRGRTRSRGHNHGSRTDFQISQNMTCLQNIPIFQVGNCEEYDDLSNNVQLFSNPKTDVNLADDSFENEELSVKVVWQSTDIVKFTIRKYQKLAQIYEYFSNKMNIHNDNLFFMYNDRILKASDTPDSINYNIAKFIEGGIVNNVTKITGNVDEKQVGGIIIKFQYPNSRKPLEMNVSRDDLLSVSMMKCAEHMEVPVKKLKFEFDGDIISGHMTAKELEMEGGECIDVKIIS